MGRRTPRWRDFHFPRDSSTASVKDPGPGSSDARAHGRYAILLSLATIVMSYAGSIYLRYLPRESGREVTWFDVVRVWIMPALLAAATICSVVVAARLARGRSAGPLVRFSAAIVLLVGLPLALILVRLLAQT